MSRACVVLAVVVLVAASVASGVGVVFAEGDDSVQTHSTLTEHTLPLLGGERPNDSARGPSSKPPIPTESPDPIPGDPPSETTSAPDDPINQTTVPSPNTSVPTPTTTVPNPGTSVPAPNTTAPGGPPENPPGNGPPGNETEPPENRTGPPGNETGPPTDPGPPENRSGPPGNLTDPPGSGSGVPGNRTDAPGNRTGPPGNGSGVPGIPGNGTGVPGRGAGLLDNATLPGNATDPSNRSERARRGPGPNVSAPSVNVTVPNATANRSVSVNVSETEAADADVAFDAVNVTPTKNGSFTLDVTASEAPIAGKTPTRELTNGTEPLAYLSVDHSISDRNISDVTFRFRVKRDRVSASERDEIAMYRYHGGTWNELPTRLVETTERHYVYQVRSPGLSEFAAGKQRPQFEIANATVDLSTLSVGDALKVQVRITNEGDADGTFGAELVLGSETVADRQLTIAAGGMRQTTFERRVTDPGTYEVYVNDFRVGEVVVDESAVSGDATSQSPTGDEETDRDDSTGQNTNASVPGLGAVTGVLTLLATLLAVRLKE
ncbi:PGF-pre-PGF domain-containing protein [Halorussus ruber]|uniref:PGF-pre-PGF domain-containing protein n=1 Tax=Halorussus ruber TaxID=1126238 RepID=UPI001B2FE9CF|nr:PGF-pre-PGF domain-containing protein [Halorussus ruber]